MARENVPVANKSHRFRCPLPEADVRLPDRAGAGVRQPADEIGRSYGTVRAALPRARGTLRKRGRKPLA
ncbi:helix-turn-helix domain-containing protein [Amycolatopsis samaneae]|uniref:Helix-turn-helix domain-containing protein n=1 Tax=Amycolatopsis samaneae TaxID=664691 RepID=A0ABW5G7D7_9PSEU